jgi:nitrate/nitrite transporter NarK
MKEIE